ncbi:DUF1294 domain-containing protein [Defluviitalea phaphyphila]|uniref:DUF1294 domain-containing protein n=1 Tax=Defluviitalea phaphyphila TaxID=1473580 RepID=UPI001FA6EB2A
MKILIFFILINFITSIVFGLDKRKAIKNKWRISEKKLIFLSFFAPLGALIGMRIFHHKTKKLKFNILIPLFLVIQMCILVYLYLIYLV